MIERYVVPDVRTNFARRLLYKILLQLDKVWIETRRSKGLSELQVAISPIVVLCVKERINRLDLDSEFRDILKKVVCARNSIKPELFPDADHAFARVYRILESTGKGTVTMLA